MMAADGYYYYRYAEWHREPGKIYPQWPNCAAKKALSMAAILPFCAPIVKKYAHSVSHTTQNPTEIQLLADILQIVYNGTKYFFDKTFLFAKITTFTITVIVKKMSR